MVVATTREPAAAQMVKPKCPIQDAEWSCKSRCRQDSHTRRTARGPLVEEHSCNNKRLWHHGEEHNFEAQRMAVRKRHREELQHIEVEAWEVTFPMENEAPMRVGEMITTIMSSYSVTYATGISSCSSTMLSRSTPLPKAERNGRMESNDT